MTLTNRERQVLAIVSELTEQNGYAPTVREVCKAAGLKSPASGHRYLTALKRAGHLTAVANRPRTLVATGERA